MLPRVKTYSKGFFKESFAFSRLIYSVNDAIWSNLVYNLKRNYGNVMSILLNKMRNKEIKVKIYFVWNRLGEWTKSLFNYILWKLSICILRPWLLNFIIYAQLYCIELSYSLNRTIWSNPDLNYSTSRSIRSQAGMGMVLPASGA